MEETQEERIQQFKDNPVLYTERWRDLIDIVEARDGEWMITEDAVFACKFILKSELEANIFRSALKLSGIKIIQGNELTGGDNHED